MSKLELSINVKYLPSWGAWEGIRELVQNGKDAEVEFGGKLVVSHYNNTLRIENEGATLSREALLFGTSSKVGRSDMIGKFGEGLKLGILALVRGGRDVKIRTGGEVWSAYIARSEKYDADVLCFDCTGGREEKTRVRVEISNVTEEDWEGLKGRFLFLNKLKKDEAVETERGQLLLSERFKGQIYVKGIFVQTDPRFECGYDFQYADVDRDRKMVTAWELSYEAAKMWTHAVAARPDLLDPFFDMMLTNKVDVQGVENHAQYAPSNTKTAVADAFKEKFGDKAVPVANLSESAEIEHLGAKGIVVGKALGAILKETIGSKDDLEKRLREEVVRTLSWSDLTSEQKSNLIGGIQLIEKARNEIALIDLVDVVEFRSSTLMGQFKNGRILIAARILDDRDETLATLVHEYSHRNGGDGEKDHVMAIENLWRDIVKNLRNGVAS